jgi:hypothetical protein
VPKRALRGVHGKRELERLALGELAQQRRAKAIQRGRRLSARRVHRWQSVMRTEK